MVTDSMMTVLDIFHHIIARRIVGVTARKGDGGEWGWDPLHEALDTMGIFPISEFVRRRQAIIMEYVAGRPIYKLCTVAEHMQESSRFLVWWDQYHVPNQI